MCQSATTELVHTTIVAAEAAVCEPAEFAGRRRDRMTVLPTSALVSVYVVDVAERCSRSSPRSNRSAATGRRN
jgi:hypothetical protein